MAEDPQIKPDSKRKYDDQTPSLPRRQTGFSAPIVSQSPDSHAANAGITSYNNVPPPADEIQVAKQRAQEIAARLFSSAEAKRPRLENGSAEDGTIKGFGSDFSQKSLGQHGFSSQVGLGSSSLPGTYGFQGSSKKIDIPNAKVGVIIGKGGETIKYLQLQSGARIQVTRDMDADPSSLTRLVELMGTPEQISKAEQLINDVIAEAEAGGSGLIAARRFSSGQSGSEQLVMKVPNNKVGLIIGKGGDTIKNMQARSGARVQLIPLHLPPGDTSTERTVQIDGTKEQIESAIQLINEVVNEVGEEMHDSIQQQFTFTSNRLRSPAIPGGYPQQGYRPPRPPTNWGLPGPPMQQPGYGYMQPGMFPGPPQYNTSQPSYGGYSQPPSGYSSGWDQSSATQNQQAAGNVGYDYYNQPLPQQQQPQQQQQPSQSGASASGDNSTYNYGQPLASNYGSQTAYGETQYSSVGQQGSNQDGYGSGSGYYPQTSQSGYNIAPSSQPGYDNAQQGYGAAPGYSSLANASHDSSVTYGTQSGVTTLPPQQAPSVQPSSASQQGSYASQTSAAGTPSYGSQGTPSHSSYAISTQPGYGSQPSAQTGYQSAATAYVQAPKATSVQPAYPQGTQQPPPTSQPGYVNPVQLGYSHGQNAPTGYAQQDPGLQRGVPYAYSSGLNQNAYGQQQLYGVPTPVPQTGFGQPQPSQAFGDTYGSGSNGYSQPSTYSSEVSVAVAASAHSAYDTTAGAGAQATQGTVTKASPQA